MPSEKQIEALDHFIEAVIDYVDKKLIKKILSNAGFPEDAASSRKLIHDQRSFVIFSPSLEKDLAKK